MFLGVKEKYARFKIKQFMAVTHIFFEYFYLTYAFQFEIK